MKPTMLAPAISRRSYPPGEEFTSFAKAHFPVPGLGVDCMLYRDYQIPWHWHDFTELNLVVSGSGEHYVDDRAFAVEAGDVFVIPTRVRHAYRQREHLDVYHLLLHERFFR